VTGSTNDRITPSHLKEALARISTTYQAHSQVGQLLVALHFPLEPLLSVTLSVQ
jgi:hypothetical protein